MDANFAELEIEGHCELVPLVICLLEFVLHISRPT